MREWKKASKKIVSFVLAMCMIIGLVPMNSLAAPGRKGKENTQVQVLAETESTSVVDQTASNVEKVLSYQAQLRSKNNKSDLSSGGLSWDTEGKSDSWRYFNGVMLDAFVMVGGEDNINYAIEFFKDNTSSDGTAKNYHSGEVDSVPMALGMFELLNTSEADRFGKAIQYVYNQLAKQTVLGADYGYNYWHKTNSDSWKTWKFGLDGLYMADTFLMEYANAIDEGKISSSVKSADLYEDVYTRMIWVADTMLDESTGLYHHGWNGSNGNGHFWGRGIGWYAVALVDTIEMMPEGDMKQELIKRLYPLFDGMIRYQDNSTGMWYNVVDKNSSLSKNKLETSVSAMMAYAMMKAYNAGWVEEVYGELGLKAFNGTVNGKLSGSEGSYKVSDVYQKSGVGTSDSYYTQNSYVADEAKGTAALIMAATLANKTAELLNAEVVEPEQPENPEDPEEPEVPEGPAEGTVVVGGKEVTVTIENVKDMTVGEASVEDLALVEEKTYSDYIFFDVEATMTGDTAVVSIPVPAEWNITSADELVGLSAEDGELKEIPGTLEDGVFSFEVAHFSGKGIARVEGSLSAGKNYQLDIDGIDTDGKYIIVAEVDGKYYALAEDIVNGDKVSTKAVEIIVKDDKFSTDQYASMEVNISNIAEDGKTIITHISNKGTLEVAGDTKFKTNETKNVYLLEAEDNQYIVYKEYRDGKYKKALLCNPSSNETKKQWTEAGDGVVAYVYFFKYAKDEIAEKVNFAVAPAEVNMRPGDTQSLIPTITLENGGAVNSSVITWTSSNSAAATVDENGLITAVADGETVITATLKTVNGTGIAGGSISVNITVDVKSLEIHPDIPPVLSGNHAVKTQLGQDPDFSDIKLTVTYEGESGEENPTADYDVNSGLVITGYDKNTVGKYFASITYKDVEYGKVLVIVEGNPYEGLDKAEEPYPTYPEDGAVRVKKTATPSDNFQYTGVGRVELDVAGISIKQGVDVVLVVDVSNSMAWTDYWFEGMDENKVADATDQDKVPEGYDVSTIDKLDQAMSAATEFAKILMKDNSAGSTSNNSLSFVTFAGNDHELGGNQDNIDSVQTVFTNVQDSSLAETSFSNTKFTALSKKNNEGGVNYTLQIGYTDGTTVKGTNRGNTNYDYAFAEAANAIDALQGDYSNYAATGRETIVVFMTDGAPSHYNNDRTNGTADDKKPDGSGKYPGNSGKYTEAQWLEYINNYNKYAADVAKLCSSMYAVGFDLDHGGFSDYSWTADELEPVLSGITSNDKDIPTMMASNGEQLREFYTSLAQSIKMAGENAQVHDIIGSDFTLQMSSTVEATNGVLGLTNAPTIEVFAYNLVQKTDPGATTATIGTRTGDKELIEKVTFSADGKAAYSSVLGENVNIMTSNADGSEVTIEAFYFTYKKVNGVETFDWNIGTITNKEIALAFDVRLKGGSMGEREYGMYYTNEEATLDYIDVNGDHATKLFPMPALAWGGLAVAYEFYLVDKDGHPVARDMETIIPINNRITVWGPGYQNFNQNEDGSVSAVIKAQDVLPAGYVLYDENATYTINYLPQDGVLVPVSVVAGGATYEVTKPENGTPHVAFAVTTYPEKQTYSLKKDEIVIDYGKAIQVDVLANDANVATEYTKTVVGYATYSLSTDQKTFFTQFTELGTGTFTTTNGRYEIVDGVVQFTPTKMLSSIEKVFVVIKFVKGEDIFYMYNELNIIPATNVYYETDFATGVFTFTHKEVVNEETKEMKDVDTWTPKYAGAEADGPQNAGTIGVDQTYGFDSTYENDSLYSNNHSYFVDGQGLVYTTAKFSFTGTGFDLISRTGAAQGSIRVDIYKDLARTNLAKSVTVLNKSESDLELYQIPVVSVENLTYGTYYVTIGVNAAYTSSIPSLSALNRGGEFYFDAIRVFNPVKGNAQAEVAYAKDNEANPELYEVRELLISASDADILTDVQGVSFIDRTQEGVSIADYTTIGPNNEVYIANTNAIAFKIDWENGVAPTSIDIGAKAITGNTAHMKAYISGAATKASEAIVDTDISSATVEFYELVNMDNAADFSAAGSAYVVIENTGSGVLSITDIKIAYGQTTATSEVSFVVDEPVMAFAMACFRMADIPEVEEPEVEPDVPEVEEPEVELNYDIISAVLSAKEVKRNKTVTLTVKTTEDVDSIDVKIASNKKAGPGKDKENAKEQDTVVMKAVETTDGIKTWTVEIKMATDGDKTLTVTGYGVDGTAGISAQATVKVKK